MKTDSDNRGTGSIKSKRGFRSGNERECKRGYESGYKSGYESECKRDFQSECKIKKLSIFSFILISVLAVMAFGLSAFAVEASPTASTVVVNGQNVAFDAYNINDNNYFKLRDLAFILSGSEKQFEVSWDEATDAISLTKDQPYTEVGGEMAGKGEGAKEAEPTASRILLNGVEVKFTAYLIDGNNYFRLRDVGAAFDFGVDWDGDLNLIVIDTGKGYSLEDEIAGSIFGFWRYEDEEEVQLIVLNSDKTFEVLVVGKDGEPGVYFSGLFGLSDGVIAMTDIKVSGQETDDLFYNYELNDDVLVLNEGVFHRIPLADAATVLSDPLAPYPPIQ
ncbi:MAG: copper amine oxidase N-terminal domain-containing protein [Oscillospiraceae bacterium]|nr:copper amine oxidase N-terminal domain-containing protein [Oscillospiraceae bacterium]